MDNNFSGGGFGFDNQGFTFDRWDSFSLDDEARAKKKFSRFFLALTVMALAASVLANLIVIIIHFALGESSALVSDGAFQMSLSAICLYAFAFPILYLLVRKMRYVPRRKEKMTVKDFFFYIAICSALMYLGSFIGTLLSEVLGIMIGGVSEDSVSQMISDTPILLTLLIVVIIGPIFEELVFRKLLMDKLGSYGDRVAIFVSATAFALYHGNLYQLFYAFAVGLVLAYVYSKTGNILHTVIIHSVLNFLGSVIPMLLLGHIEKLEEILPELEAGTVEALTEHAQSIMLVGTYSLLQYALIFAGIFLLFRYRRTFFVSDRCEVLIPRERRARVILGNFGSILFLVYCSVSIIFNLISPLIMGVLG